MPPHTPNNKGVDKMKLCSIDAKLLDKAKKKYPELPVEEVINMAIEELLRD